MSPSSESNSSFQKAEIGEVPSHWDVLPLSEFTTRVTYGFTNPMPDAEEGPYKLTAKDINDGRILYESARKTTQEAFDNDLTDKSRPAKGDVLLTKDGSIGRVAICDTDGLCISQSVAVLKPNDRIESRFLKYVLTTPHYQRRMIGDADGTTIKHIYITRVNKMEVAIPPLPEQRAIASILGALDDKIELNRRMNATLESLARAIFKSWFVDFDPVHANAIRQNAGKTGAGQMPASSAIPTTHDPKVLDLFPSTFQDSGIPEGWSAETIGDHVELQRGKTYKSKLKNEPGPYLLGLGTIERNGGFRANKLVTYGGDSPDNLLMYPGDLYVSLKDVTQSADLLGAVARVPTSVEVGRLTQDTVKLVLADDSVSSNILYRTLLTPAYRSYCRNYATGTTNLGLAREDFLGYPVVVPTDEVQKAFDDTMHQIEGQIDTNERESSSLGMIRDALLPQLLSGELPVDDFITATEEVLANA